MRRILTTIALLLLLTLPTFAGFSRVTQSVRPLQADAGDGTLRNMCTTTSISEKRGYWLTAAHCIEQPTYIQGEQTETVKSDRQLDIAVLHTPKLRVRSLKLQGTAPKVGQRVRMVGHPLGLSTQFFQGYIASLATSIDGARDPFMLFDMAACGGNSGSSVVNTRDEIVSVLQIGFGRPCSTPSGGSPWAVLAKFVGQYVD